MLNGLAEALGLVTVAGVSAAYAAAARRRKASPAGRHRTGSVMASDIIANYTFASQMA